MEIELEILDFICDVAGTSDSWLDSATRTGCWRKTVKEWRAKARELLDAQGEKCVKTR